MNGVRIYDVLLFNLCVAIVYGNKRYATSSLDQMEVGLFFFAFKVYHTS